MLKTLVGGTTPIFTTVWKTDNAGTSTSTQIKWPTVSTGTYNCTVNWGDGNSSTITTYNDAAWTHTYASAGTYTVKIVGTFTGISFNNGGDRLKLLQIASWGRFRFGTVGSAFFGCANLTITARDVPVIGTDSLVSALRQCTSIVTIPSMNAWDVSAVTSLNSMVQGSTSFNQNIGSWNVSSVSTFNSTFSGATSFNQNIGSWNVSGATIFTLMFQGATSFNQNIGSWNVSSVTSFSSMFSGATAFNGNIGSWNVSAGTTFNTMFQNATAFNQNIGSWNVSSATSFSSTFVGATSFNQNIGSWNVSSVTVFNAMFSGATSFNQNIGSWNVSSGTTFVNMFLGVTLSNANYNLLLNGWSLLTLVSGRTFNGGNSHYDTTSGGVNGVAARAVLTSAPNNWVISDGGTP